MNGSPDRSSDASAEVLRAPLFARTRLLIGAWYGTSALLVALLAWRVTGDADGRSDWFRGRGVFDRWGSNAVPAAVDGVHS